MYHLIEILPVVLCHETEGAEKRPAKVIKRRIIIIWVAVLDCQAFVTFLATITNEKHQPEQTTKHFI